MLRLDGPPDVSRRRERGRHERPHPRPANLVLAVDGPGIVEPRIGTEREFDGAQLASRSHDLQVGNEDDPDK